MAQDKLSKSKSSDKQSLGNPGPSPFKGRKSEHDMMTSSAITSSSSGAANSKKSEQDSVASRRKSFLPASSAASSGTQPDDSGGGGGEDRSPEDSSEADDVLRRGARGQGLGGDILKEMRVRQEMKRASFVPKTEHSESKEEGGKPPFGNVFLR